MLDKRILGRLLNSRGTWICNDDLVFMMRAAAAANLDPADKKTLTEMQNTFIRGDFIQVTTERMRLVYNLGKKLKIPNNNEFARVARQLQLGAEIKGIIDAPWIQDALNLLNSFTPSSITEDDESDE